jgi:hypothetical protein
MPTSGPSRSSRRRRRPDDTTHRLRNRPRTVLRERRSHANAHINPEHPEGTHPRAPIGRVQRSCLRIGLSAQIAAGTSLAAVR